MKSTVTPNLLTIEQREGRQHALFDLAIGYPTLAPDVAIENHLELWAGQAMSSTSLARTAPLSGIEPNRVLREAIAKLVGMRREFLPFIEVTFSGSIALQRSIVAAHTLAYDRGFDRCHFTIFEPAVDFYRAMLEETQVAYTCVNRMDCELSERGSWVEQVSTLVRERAASHDGEFQVVILDAPSNPLGTLIDHEDLKTIAAAIGQAEGLLIADHCFAIAGVHEPRQASLVFATEAIGCDWIAIWDTGKTFDLNGDKLGVLVASNERVHSFVIKALGTIQVTPSNRDVLFFSQFLSHPVAVGLIERLRRESQQNASFLSTLPLGVDYTPPAGGTFGVLIVPNASLSSIAIRHELLGRGLAVSSGASFWSTKNDLPVFIRLSLARPHEVFVEAASRLQPFPGL